MGTELAARPTPGARCKRGRCGREQVEAEAMSALRQELIALACGLLPAGRAGGSPAREGRVSMQGILYHRARPGFAAAGTLSERLCVALPRGFSPKGVQPHGTPIKRGLPSCPPIFLRVFGWHIPTYLIPLPLIPVESAVFRAQERRKEGTRPGGRSDDHQARIDQACARTRCRKTAAMAPSAALQAPDKLIIRSENKLSTRAADTRQRLKPACLTMVCDLHVGVEVDDGHDG